MRTAHGWTVAQVAEQLSVSLSKISRLETGHRGASQRDIADLCDLYEVDDELRQHLSDLAAEGKQQAWWQARNLRYSDYVGLEAAAESISDFCLGLMPGMLQTTDYAGAILRAHLPRLSEEQVGQRLDVRLARQRLLTSQQAPQFQAVLAECVLYQQVGSQSIMRSQLERLLAAAELPNVSIRVVPYAAGVLPSSNNKFIILRFDAPVPSVVFIEALTGDLYLDRPEDVAIYSEAFDITSDLAASEHDSLGMINAAVGRLGQFS